MFPSQPLLKHVLLLCMSTPRIMSACMMPETRTELCNPPRSCDTPAAPYNSWVLLAKVESGE